MARFHHLPILLVVSLLLLAGLSATTAIAAAVDTPGGKKVTISMRYAAADPGKKVRISVRYVDEDGPGASEQFRMDSDDDEPLGIAVQYLLSTLEKFRDDEASSRAEL